MFNSLRDNIKNQPFKLAVLAILLILPIALMLFEAQLHLRYQALAILDKQYWRWLTAHWVHLTWGHLWMNWLALLILMVSFFENLDAKGWLWLCLGLSLLTSIVFIGFAPELHWYVGLSGILHGLFVFLVLQDHKLTALLKALFIAGLGIKLVWEQIYGAIPGSAKLAGGNVVVDAHLYGAISGLLIFLTYIGINRAKSGRYNQPGS